MDYFELDKIKEMVLAYMPAFIIGAVLVLLIFVLWLIFRSVRLWYWKVDKNVEMLKNIADNLNYIKGELGKSSPQAYTHIDNQTNQTNEKEHSSIYTVSPQQIPTELQNTQETQSEEAETECECESIYRYTTRDSGHTKTGKVYTREEIEACIRE